jgi:AcrR family transcriptional regulator
MPRTGGYLTRQKILDKAKRLFARNGIDGTSLDDIAAGVGVHKASLFYHFKNKQAIINALYAEILHELDDYIDKASEDLRRRKKAVTLKDQIKMEIEHLSSKNDIITVMLAETLKKGNGCNSFFECARKVFQAEHPSAKPSAKNMTHEFFTGFLPLVAFIVFREKWGHFVQCSDDTLLEHFLTSFDFTHLRTQPST